MASMVETSIPEKLIPEHISYLKAKSLKRSKSATHQETLADHTWDVLSRLSDQVRLRPNLPQSIQDERLWHRLYWACFLHDFGKAATGFQERLMDSPPANEWATGQHRHEVLSLAFIDGLFPRGHQDRQAIITTIASHHKDLSHSMIYGKYGLARRRTEDQERRITYLIDQIDERTASDLWQWLTNYAVLWADHLQIPLHETPAINETALFSAQSVKNALEDCGLAHILYKDGETSLTQNVHAFIYRGLILTSDHSASAHAPIFPNLNLTTEIANKPIRWPKRKHQKQAETSTAPNAIMIAPTGSGKTEAALLWAANQNDLQPFSRLFYTLPYQASMNAMANRLLHHYFQPQGLAEKLPLTDRSNTQVIIQHSRARLKFYQMLMDTDDAENPKAQITAAKHLRNLSQLSYYPVQVFSPYQMLKASYSLKGYETLLLDYTNALFIFDEIHAYDPKRLALILETIKWLRTNFHARFLVMTATLPPMLLEKLEDALGQHDLITADQALFEESQRHTVHIREGYLLDDLEHILQQANTGQTILICCNQVARAQTAFRFFKEHLGEDHVTLLHGRFNGKDRNRQESRLLDAVRVGNKDKLRPYVVVATQAVEVSLDIDLDTLYTEPAPIEALLQRFGRVNRGRTERILCPVHVYREPATDENEARPYELDIVQASLAELEKIDSQPIDESQVNAMLSNIYAGAIKERWLKDYNDQAKLFRRDILNTITPFTSADISQRNAFYKMFDGIDVLPLDCMDDYYDTLETEGYLAASQYLVNISNVRYRILYGNGKVHKDEDENDPPQVNVPYSEEYGLDFDG
jgi:CRISPR-associated endonuclease/helicase Cas3